MLAIQLAVIVQEPFLRKAHALARALGLPQVARFGLAELSPARTAVLVAGVTLQCSHDCDLLIRLRCGQAAAVFNAPLAAALCSSTTSALARRPAARSMKSVTFCIGARRRSTSVMI